jgi:UDP-sulfoquinovose synthase
MYLSRKGHQIAVLDNFAKRRWELELGVEPLMPISTLHERVRVFQEISGVKIQLYIGDLQEYPTVEHVIRDFQPEALVHYGEQPSAPYSMIDQAHAVHTQVNNVTGTLNVLFAMRAHTPTAHLVKLGTMGEYGTPNIDIEEGFIEIEHHGRRDVLPFPKQPGSFYHLSKVHDSHNVMFACRAWGLCSTDLNQGVVYGIETEETRLNERLVTSFHYDEVFGTVLNRFCVQAVCGIPLTPYGKGGQKRGFLNINDTLQCVELALLNPPPAGEYRVFNQFTEIFSVMELAELVQQQGRKMDMDVNVASVANPRVEAEEHYYNPQHTKLVDLGLEPRYLSQGLLERMLTIIAEYRDRVRQDVILPRVRWQGAT